MNQKKKTNKKFPNRFLSIRNAFLLLVVLFFPVSEIFSQAGKIQSNSVRIYGNLNSGKYESDWINHNQGYSLFNLAIDSDWKGKNGLGYKFGVDYFFKFDSKVLNYFFVGLETRSFDRKQSYDSIGSFVAINQLSSELRIYDFNVGAVLFNDNSFRIKPKLVFSKVNQDISGNGIILSNSVFASLPVTYGLESQNTNKSSAVASMVGSTFEFDIKENLTLFADVLIINPFLFRYYGTYSSNSNGLGVASGNSISGGLLQSIGSNGTYQLTGGRIELGAVYSIMETIKLSLSVADTFYKSTYSNPFSYSIVGARIDNGTSTSTGIAVDTIQSTIGEVFASSKSHTLSIININFGVSKDIIF